MVDRCNAEYWGSEEEDRHPRCHPERSEGSRLRATTLRFFGRRYPSAGYGGSFVLDRSLNEIRPTYRFDISCQGSVPQSIIAFLESEDFEDAVRKAISLGGDSDTMACIAGGIAQAFYTEIPREIASTVRDKLPEGLLEVVDEFCARCGLR